MFALDGPNVGYTLTAETLFEPPDGGDGDGCGCVAGTSSGSSLVWLAGLLLLAIRIRARRTTRNAD